MHRFTISAAMLAAAIAWGGPAHAANMCKTASLSCATTMPVGGYCECTARGTTEDGTVAERPAARRRINATAGGCEAHPHSPGCAH